jgi:hypothetical protein
LPEYQATWVGRVLLVLLDHFPTKNREVNLVEGEPISLRFLVGVVCDSNAAGVDRVVALSLDHGFATVYDWHRVSAPDPAALIKAVRGIHEAPDSQEGSKRAGTDSGRSPDKSPARRARMKEATNKDKAARTPRGKGM